MVGLAGLSACDVGDLDPRDDDPTPAATTGAPVDADRSLVDDVVAELLRMGALVAQVQARFPGLRRSTAPWRRLHATHLEALAGDAEAPPATGRLTTAAEAMRQVRTQEAQLQRRLADWSVAAGSGALARLLASMSAAVAQQLAAPAPSTRDGEAG